MVARKIWRNETCLIVILISLCLILFCFRSGSRPLWNPDEGMHAATSKEMVLTGDWITPTFNGKPFYDKPVFYNWLVCLSFVILGFNEFAARLPSALLGTGCVALTYLFGRKMYGSGVGLLAAAILATSVEFIIICKAVVHDISLVFFVTLALYFFYSAYRDDRHRQIKLWLFYAALGFAVLSKGPVGLALPAMIIGLYLIVEKNMRFVGQMKIGWGILIFLAIASPWYILVSLKNPGYFEYFFIKQNLGSFLSSDSRHPNPFYYYIPILFGGFFPWSCFLPLAFMYVARRKFQSIDTSPAFPVIWFSVIFIFFSAAGSKLATYILPLFPAVSLLVALCWQELLHNPREKIRRGFLYSYLPLVVIFAAAAVYLCFNPQTQLEYEAGINPLWINFLAFWMLGFISVAFFFFLRIKYASFLGSIIAMVVSTMILFLVIIVPAINPYRSTKELALKYDQLIPAQEKFMFYSRIRESALFYTDRKASVLDNPAQLRDYLSAERRVYCIITRKWLARLALAPYVVDRHGDKLLISNKNSNG